MIRAEQVDDHRKIEEINARAFGQPDEGRLVAAIRKSKGFDSNLSLVADVDGQLVGHILFSPIFIGADASETLALALAPMSVIPEFQRQGIGTELVTAGLLAASRAGHSIIVVAGHADFYPRFGFERASLYGITPPFDVPDEVFMVNALTLDALGEVNGEVRYPSVFNEL